MSSYRSLGSVILRRTLTFHLRYPIDTFSQIAIIYVMFLLTLLGGQAAGVGAITDSVETVIIGFFLFTLVSSAYSKTSRNIVREAQWGTLEQLFLSPFGFGKVVLVTLLSNVLISTAYGTIVLLLAMVTTQTMLSIPLLTVVPLGLLTLCSAFGISLGLSGLTLVYKRVENVFQLVQFGFIALIIAPVYAQPLLKLLPIALGSRMMLQSVTSGTPLWSFPLIDLLLVFGTGIGYLLAGYLVLKYCIGVARQDGALGHY